MTSGSVPHKAAAKDVRKDRENPLDASVWLSYLTSRVGGVAQLVRAAES